MHFVSTAPHGMLPPHGRPPNARCPKPNIHHSTPRSISVAASSLQTTTVLHDTLLIAGGGPAGLAAAVALRRIGLTDVVVLEKEPTRRPTGTALGLWTNAWRALDALGAGDALRARHPRIDRVDLCRQDGRTLKSFDLQRCDGGPHEFRGVKRSNLVDVLGDLMPAESVVYGEEMVGVDRCDLRDGGAGVKVHLASGKDVECAAVLAADGVRSAGLSAAGRGPARYVGQVAIRGIAHVPNGIDCRCIRQVWSVGPRAGMYPISPTELYWFVCFDADADTPVPSSPEEIKKEALSVVQHWAWGLPQAVEASLPQNLTRSRLADRLDVFGLLRPPPNASTGLPLTLAGDALHPMTPNLGQGGCTALEDAVVLAREVSASGAVNKRGQERSNALMEAFQAYEKQRSLRCLPLIARSRAMGAALQLPLAPVAAVRDVFIAKVFDPGHFLDHATFDCGKL